MSAPTPPSATTTVLAGPGTQTRTDWSDVMATRDLFWQNIVREMLTSLAVLADARRSQIVAEMQARLGQYRVGNATITTSPDLGPAVPGQELVGVGAAGGAEADQGLEDGTSGAGGGGGGGADEDGSESDGADADYPGGQGIAVRGRDAEAEPEEAPDGTSEEGAGVGMPRPGFHPAMPLDGHMAVLTKGGERIPIADVRPLLACSVPGTDVERALSTDVQCTIFQIVAPSGEVFTLPLHEIRAIHAISAELMAKLAEAAHRQDAESGRPGDDPDAKPFGFAAFTSLARSKGR